MSSQEINPQQIDPHTSETHIGSGELARVPRIVLFGNRSTDRSRAIEFIKDAIKDVPNAEVGAARRVDLIEEAFYGRVKLVEEQAIEPSEHLQKPGLLKRITDLVLRRTVKPTDTSGVRFKCVEREDTIPQGVIIFPEMRQHDSRSGSNMTVKTPVETIATLCRKHGVPMAFVGEDGNGKMSELKQVTQGLPERER